MFIYRGRTNQRAELEVTHARDDNVTGASAHVIVGIILIDGSDGPHTPPAHEPRGKGLPAGRLLPYTHALI